MNAPRHYDSISPSATSLLLMKGLTDIPYAREAAAVLQGPEVFGLDFDNKDLYFWMRVMHFESRYWSIDQLLKTTAHPHILELSSGFSFRGLDMCRKEAVHYIDTDLPDIIRTKTQLIEDLNLLKDLKGTYTLRPLNALDETSFNEIVGAFPDGPITIVNEGLLMYLNTDEKTRLCRIIHQLLKTRGGVWITADIYPKLPENVRSAIPQSASENAFFEQHRIEENKFDSFEAAEQFFNEHAFRKVNEAQVDYSTLTAVTHIMELLPPEVLEKRQPPPKIQATWMMEAF